MWSTIKTALTSLMLLIALCFGANAAVPQNSALGDFTATQHYTDQNPEANQLASLESFGFYQKHASECCNATNSRPAHLTSHPQSHTIERHGPQVTDQQLETRALTGIAADGSTLRGNRIPPLSSAFHSEGAMLRADSVMRGQPLQDAIAANPTATRLTIPPFDVGENIGRGYRRIGSGNPNNVGRNGPPERVDGLSHATATVELNPTTGAWETITMFPALP